MNQFKTNNYNLLKFDNKILVNRIKRELKLLVKEGICNEENIFIIKNIEDELVVMIKKINDNKYYEFTITRQYPFIPPKVKINNKHVLLSHRVDSNLFKKSLLKHTGIDCFCCETILCSYNWSPTLTLKHIFEDLQRFTEAARKVVIIIIINVIKRKYLIDDIPIIEWLY